MGDLKKNKPIYKKKFFILGLASYLLVAVILLAWIDQLQPRTGSQVDKITIEENGTTLSINGQHLNEMLDVIIAPSPQHQQAIVSTTHTWGKAYDVKIHNQIAWVASHNRRLTSYNLGDPSHPKAIGSVELPGRPWSITISDHYALIAGTKAGLIIVDILRPDQPQLLSTLQLPGTAVGIEIHGDQAIIASGKGGIHIVDIKNKRAPALISSLPLDDYMEAISIQDSLAYVSGTLKANKLAGTTYVIDFSCPEQPKVINQLNFPQRVRDNTIIDKRLYCGTDNGIYSFEINRERGTATTLETNNNIFALRLMHANNKLFVISRSRRIYEYSIEHGGLQKLKTFILKQGSSLGMDINGPLAAAACNTNGLTIIDLSHPGDVKKMMFSTGDNNRKPKELNITGNNLLIKNGFKLHIAKKNKPDSFELIDTITFPRLISSMTTDGDIAYLALPPQNGGEGTLNLVDLGSKTKKRQLSALPLKKNIVSMAKAKQRLYLCQTGGNILSIDISDKYKPKILTKEEFPTKGNAIIIRDNLGYVATEPNALEIFTLHQRAAPTLLSQVVFPFPFDTSSRINDIQIKGNVILVSNSQGILSIDVSQPQNPIIADAIATSQACSSIQTLNNYAYLDCATGEMTIIDIANPNKMKQLCELDHYQNFTVHNDNIFYLEADELRVEKLPIVLKKLSSTPTTIRYQLPSDVDSGTYDLYLSDTQKMNTHKRALVFTHKQNWQKQQLIQ